MNLFCVSTWPTSLWPLRLSAYACVGVLSLVSCPKVTFTPFDDFRHVGGLSNHPRETHSITTYTRTHTGAAHTINPTMHVWNTDQSVAVGWTRAFERFMKLLLGLRPDTGFYTNEKKCVHSPLQLSSLFTVETSRVKP